MHSYRFVFPLVLASVTAGCDFILPDDDDGGDAGLVADAGGSVHRLSGGVDSSSVVWTASVAATDSVSFARSGATVLVGAGAALHGLDEDTGEELWSVELVDQVVGLVSGDGRAYGLGFTALTAVDVATGAVAWTLDFTSQSVTNVSFADPVFAAGSVYLGGDPVRKIDGATGLVEATYSTGDSEMLGLAAADSAVYIGTRNGIFALTPDLVETWSHAPGEEVDRIAPTNVGVFYSQVGAGVGLVTRQGGPVWNDDDGGVYEALVATENLVLGARLQGTLEAWTPSDGVSAWTANETSSPVRGLAVSNSTVFFAGGGFVQGLDLTDGTVLWEWSPAMAPVGLSAL